MIKAALGITVLLTFSFFAGVNYSDAIKKNYSWIFEAEESSEESRVELPAISQQEFEEPQKVKPLKKENVILEKLSTE